MVAPSTSPPGCKLTWDLTGAPFAERYAMAIVAESQNGAQISGTPIQFTVETVPSPLPQCTPDGFVQTDIGVPVNANFIGTGSSDLSLGFHGSAGTTAPNPGLMAARSIHGKIIVRISPRFNRHSMGCPWLLDVGGRRSTPASKHALVLRR